MIKELPIPLQKPIYPFLFQKPIHPFPFQKSIDCFPLQKRTPLFISRNPYILLSPSATHVFNPSPATHIPFFFPTKSWYWTEIKNSRYTLCWLILLKCFTTCYNIIYNVNLTQVLNILISFQVYSSSD